MVLICLLVYLMCNIYVKNVYSYKANTKQKITYNKQSQYITHTVPKIQFVRNKHHIFVYYKCFQISNSEM